MRNALLVLLAGVLLRCPGPVQADDIGRAQPRILKHTHQILDAADTIKERQANLESKVKYLVKSLTGDRRNIFIRFHHETESLHGRARDLGTNKLLDKVGLQKSHLEKEIAFLEAYDRADD